MTRSALGLEYHVGRACTRATSSPSAARDASDEAAGRASARKLAAGWGCCSERSMSTAAVASAAPSTTATVSSS
eukprot:CAMPEP_0204425532 /NCGR_PEP_ID=MMETSP0470-20130426/49481_1 /ASSEMBLY_ACC=CAM_ASM_000385 /TAXON_ID=2969 /ORGANISM="Oxyrrhis marina" /LENGTH=73 /DNA_ID=CAMNT_0051423153 /DNA_START=48 /DNA_END=266 /DNA_ORIENTATION=+